jgi:hypothetical protein
MAGCGPERADWFAFARVCSGLLGFLWGGVVWCGKGRGLWPACSLNSEIKGEAHSVCGRNQKPELNCDPVVAAPEDWGTPRIGRDALNCCGVGLAGLRRFKTVCITSRRFGRRFRDVDLGAKTQKRRFSRFASVYAEGVGKESGIRVVIWNGTGYMRLSGRRKRL